MPKFLSKFRLPYIAGDASSPSEGEAWYNANLGQFKYQSPNGIIDVAEGLPFNSYTTTRWYQLQTGNPTTANLANNRVYTYPFVLPRKGTLSGIAFEISTAWGTTAGNVRYGLFADNGSMSPGDLISDYGLVAATLGVKANTVSTALNPGTYWVALSMLGGSGTAGQARAAQGLHWYIGDSAGTPNFNSTLNCYYSDTGFTGAFPSSFGSIAGVVGGPRFAVRFSA